MNAVLSFLVLLFVSFVVSQCPSGDPLASNADGLTLAATFECISVYFQFSGDGNDNNAAVLEYRVVGASWIRG